MSCARSRLHRRVARSAALVLLAAPAAQAQLNPGTLNLGLQQQQLPNMQRKAAPPLMRAEFRMASGPQD